MSDDCFITALRGARVVPLSRRRSRVEEAGGKKGGGGVDEIISRLIQRRYGAECAGAPAELSIQSPPPAGVKGGKEVARLEEINLPARLSSQSHHTAGKKNIGPRFPPRAAPSLRPLALCWDVFVGILLDCGRHLGASAICHRCRRRLHGFCLRCHLHAAVYRPPPRH